VYLGKDKAVSKIISRLNQVLPGKGVLKAEGTWGSFAPLLIGYISEKIQCPILYIRPHIDDADKAVDDLHTFGARGFPKPERLGLGVPGNIEPLAAWEGEEELADATDEIRAERLKLAIKVLNEQTNLEAPLIIPASIQALCQPIPNKISIEQNNLQLGIGKELSPEYIAGWLVDNGFESVEKIDLPGQFAKRGGIIDIFAPVVSQTVLLDQADDEAKRQVEQAVRIEFFGDRIESIRQLNLDTYRSVRQIEKITIISALCGTDEKSRELFTNLLAPQTLVILEEPGEIEEAAKPYSARLENARQLYQWEDIYKSLQKFAQLHIYRFGPVDDDCIRLNISSIQPYQQSASAAWSGHKAAIENLVKCAREGKTIYLYCENAAEIERVSEIIKEIDTQIPSNLMLVKGFVNQGFVINSLNTVVISHSELFGQYSLRRLQRPARVGVPIDTISDLQAGDYVVHSSYGIGKFLGIKTIKEKEGTGEFLTIEYADDVRIHISVSNIQLVQKYIGTSPKRPKLSKIGSKKWQKQKEKVAKSVQDLAVELLEVQAKRQLTGGLAFSADSNWQREFEESFLYQETADQTKAIEEIKADMQQNIAMDRLLCGDVGYGKTELAMRAAFKTVENGRQVAVLVPTTVLCVQHGRTFTERFADFPVCIEILNRFKTGKQAADIIQRTKEGKVDILIGTHRILSGDVGFKDLGLVIIDEEQRFGVEHKEKLKRLRINVDVLTMTATPIPRTLHMSLLGLRDISSLATPPLDRRSIVTSVTSYRGQLIRRAILCELGRSGQVFFLHNRVKTIDKKAWEIVKLLEGSDAKIGVAHGRMHKSELEKTMIDFVEGRIDVLVCTTIIESGLDIPNANTIIIDNADRFGLAELHQLRGRVGRYKHRAFAYMLLPEKRPVTPLAARRLKAIEDYSHLGAGFKIALRDLEIRGAGNILGPEQSGHIQTIGYQMYCQLLVMAVRKLKNEPEEKIITTNIDIGITTYIPKNYITSERGRLDFYRKIAAAQKQDDLKDISDEMKDMFGPLPEEVTLLMELAGIRIAAGRAGIKAIAAAGQNLVFTFAEQITESSNKLFSKINGKIRIADNKTIYLQLAKPYFEPQTLINVLRKIFATN
jgi:transcription-repair coupling factor (superfamily II helicase)